MTRNRAKERASQAARIARERIAASRDLAPGERLIQHYCHDAAECDCAPERAPTTGSTRCASAGPMASTAACGAA